ncbi:MAG: hypothetical protein KDA28_12555, partial [Phycisphaerales bacterium]|nr:hypothetical protein [Phycisphaerales bacterium]
MLTHMAGFMVASAALAEPVPDPIAQPIPQVVIDSGITSGHVFNTTADEQVLFSTVIEEPGAPWLRLRFDDVRLDGDAYLRVTSLEDEAVQFLFREHIRQWRSTSAYFNGNAVRVELIAGPDEGGHVVIDEVMAGVVGGQRSQCGPTDDRLPSDDARVGRIMPVTCTAWIIDDCNHCLFTAGHCSSQVEVMQFNVPLSDSNGSINHPPPEDQYPVDPTSHQTNFGQGVGNDWAYFGVFPNSNTGLTPAEAQGAFFVLTAPVDEPGREIRITGNGSVPSSVPAEWNYAQKTHVGPLVGVTGTRVEYQTDTTGGNSGSPIIDEATNTAIGIHTHGGCSTIAGNLGTSSQLDALQAALAAPLGVCAPPLPDFSFPAGRPNIVAPDGSDTFVLEITATDAIPIPGTAMLHYDDGSGPVSVALTQTSDNVYDVTFPASA